MKRIRHHFWTIGRRFLVRFGTVAWLALTLSTGPAVLQAEPAAPPSVEPPSVKPQTGSGGSVVGPAATPTDRSLRRTEYWDVFRVRGSQIGYAQTTIRPVTEGGQNLIRIDIVNHLKLNRFGQVNEEELRLVSVESSSGQVRRVEAAVSLGLSPTTVAGQVRGEHLELEVTTAGRVAKSRLPWSPEVGGFYATEQCLAHRPMQAGEQRKFRALMPLLNVVTDVQLKAVGFESTELLHGTYELLRVESQVKLPDGQALESVLWADRNGEVHKSFTPIMGQETFRVTREEALEKTDAAAFDLGEDLAVRVARPIVDPHRTFRIRYRVTLDGGDPAAAFVRGTTQSVRSLGPHEAEIVVTRLDMAPEATEGLPKDPVPRDDDRQPNSIVQSDDAKVAELAAKAVGNESDAYRVAAALESYVHDVIAKKDFSQAFATAAEVARSLQGDCTEHAVLLAALARARGIPSRAAIGLVYTAAGQGFYYHMWNELYLDGHWIPADATLGRGGIGAAHLKVAQTSLRGASAYSSLLPVAQVLGRLKIEVLEVE